MDAFETIRIVASRLHDRFVAEGADALRPLTLVEAAISHYGLELVFLEPGNIALNGGRAVFDRQSGTICAEDKGSDADHALLVGHEIGHAAIHTKSSCCSDSDIDPSRSTEAAPVGLQKVEDYGARERRELEANVFAREFLFPRGLARTDACRPGDVRGGDRGGDRPAAAARAATDPGRTAPAGD